MTPPLKNAIVNPAPTLRNANWLYLITALLIISVGAVLQNWSFGLGLVGTEVLLILLPVLVGLRLNRLPVATTLRLNWPGSTLVGLGLTAGIGLWLLDSAIDNFTVLLFGYTPPATPDTYPGSLAQAVLVFIALAMAAPLCEEALFRGYIQRAYEAQGRRWSIVAVGLLFAFYHFRLQGLAALLPIAFTLGYLRARSGSLWPSVAAHFANNALAAIVLSLVGLRPDWLKYLPIGSLPGAILGLGLLVVALWLFTRLTPQPTTPALVDSPRSARLTLGASLPLAGVVVLYIALASLELILGRNPELFATDGLALDSPPWKQATRWEYDIRNVQDESVGRSECVLTITGSDYALNCQTQIRAFKVELPGSFYQSGDGATHLTMRWSGVSLNLIEGELHQTGDGIELETLLEQTSAGSQLVVTEAGMTQTLRVPEEALLPEEWPWRLMALPFSLGLSQRVDLARPSRWRPEIQASSPAVEPVVVSVAGAEPVAVPAGNFITWRVRVGKWTAWYDVNAPHTLVRYDAGFAFYVLTMVTP